MRVALYDYQGKARLIRRALVVGGHEVVTPPAPADVVLVDQADRELCDLYPKVIVYPHGGGVPELPPPHPNTVGAFTCGSGQAASWARLDVPSCVVGFTFCEQLAFRQPTRRHLRVLMAPEHHSGEGNPREPGINSRAAVVHDWLADSFDRVTVRWVPVAGSNKGLDYLGISPRGGVCYHAGDPDVDDAVAAVDRADLVVAEYGTLPHLAIARGVPTMMYRSDELPGPPYVWEADESVALADVVAWATTTEADHYRERYIGPPFDTTRFLEVLEAAVGK